MPLVYRAVLDDTDGEIARRVEPLFAAWMHEKGLTTDDFAFSPGMSTALSASDDPAWIQRRSVRLDRSGGQLHRIRLVEETPEGRWTTTALWATEAAQQQVIDVGHHAPEQLAAIDLNVGAARHWIWIDLEQEPSGGRPLRPGSPRLVRDLMAAGEAHDGRLPLTAEALMVTVSHVSELVSYLGDPNRRVPIVVFAHDPHRAYDQNRLARLLARDLAGVAAVFRLADGVATAAFGTAVPDGYEVYGGALRTYLPGALAVEDAPTRHRVLGRTSITTLGSRAFPAVKDQILHLSTQRPGPLDALTVRRLLAEPATQSLATTGGQPSRSEALLAWFGRQVVRIRSRTGAERSTPDFRSVAVAQRTLATEIDALLRDRTAAPLVVGAREDDLEQLRAELAASEADREVLGQLLTEAEAEAREIAVSVRRLTDDAEYLQLEVAEAARDSDAARRRARWLESQVREAGLSAWQAPAEVVHVPASVAEVLVVARSRLRYVVIGATDQVAAELDVHPGAELFAAKTWNALMALEDYAAAVAGGDFAGSFHLWCQSPPASATAISATALSLVESESVDSHPDLRSKRTFPVPPTVHPSERLYMPAHIKVVKRGAPAPRLHFHDDTRGATGCVHVGYVGPHLPTAQFK
ncbi:hypothetical protein E9549_13075 [Blastococcus sp. MG754426]|uniref:hypothetical protein n=1 Tax=unclassified Blastococcus TaxID=2619396 RepID=UPI001EF15373|nr:MULTISPECIES: hypothetical protein [unclassified Blastococcus]MCF6508330.1 hypothetical protein [Blastococcus sp. MG754426]MCF6513038.1 hypothetical protein [Blastococcus sp. MG754427]MCF6734083.1 hypothetical protein [Blastococcus sp. KM273129]